MRKRVAGIALAIILAGAGTAQAQVAWETPMVMVPRGQDGLGLYLLDVGMGDMGFMATWQSSRSQPDIGFRAGLAEQVFDDVAVFGGIDLSGALTRESPEFPLDVDWLLGAGLAVGDDLLLSFPAGISIAHTFTGDGVRFVPYITPRVILDAFFGDGPGDDLELDAAVDVGLELGFQPGWAVRFGATLGDRREDGLAVGVVF